MNNTSVSNGRWYDQAPKTSTAINLLLMFPDSVQEVLGSNISTLAENKFDVTTLMGNLKSLGTARVLALYKAESKRRMYDQLSGMHKAMNYLFVMPDEKRDQLVDDVRELTNCVSQYLQMCQANRREATIKEISQLASTYVKSGLPSARYFIKRIENDDRTQRLSNAPTGEFTDTDNMRISFKDEL